MQRLIELWNETPDFTFLQKLGIGLMCLVFGIAFYAINWYLAKESIAEYGYPKWSGKRKRRLFKTYSFSDKLFLYSHWKHAKNRGGYLHLCWVLQLFSLACVLATLVGFVCFLTLPAKGWQIILILFLPLGSFAVSIAMKFIPDLICLPSERHRYFK